MQDQKLKVNIVGDASQLVKALNTASGNLESFGKKVSGIGKKLSIGLTLPLVAAGGAAIKMASDFDESLNKVNVAFGSASDSVKEFSKNTLQQFGIAQGTALDMAALFGDMSTSMGLSVNAAADMSTALVGIAGDLASFKNMDIGEATTALAGIFTGETESLKRLGVVMTQVNLEQFAMNQGIRKSIKEMTEAEKVNLRYQFVMAKTANAHGDFARTGGGAANQMRIFQESLKELAASFGATILPAFTSLVQYANKVLLKFKNLDDSTKRFIMIAGGIVAAIGPALVVIGSMASGFGAVASGMATVIPLILKAAGAFKTLTVAMLSNPVGAIVASIVALVTAFVEYLHQLEPAVSRTKTFFNIIKSLGNPIKFAALQAADAAEALEEEKKQAEAAAKKNKELEDALKGMTIQANQAENAATGLGMALEKVEKVSALSLTIEKGSFDYIKGEFEKADIAVNVKPLQTAGLGGISAPSPDEVGAALQGLLQIQNQANQSAQAIQKFNEHQERMADLGMMVGGQMAGAFSELGAVMVQSLGMGEGALGSFAGAFLSAALDAVAASLSAAIAAAIAGASQGSLLAGPAAPILLPALLAGMVGLVKSQFASVPKFANGGIVSGPTLGLMGEYPGASSNPEVIAPLDKLQGMMGGRSQNVNVGGEFKINGQDLVVALQRADRNRSRIK